MTGRVVTAHGQASYAVRLEWGPTGALAVARDVDVAVVVDVLSFTTTLTVALERGITVVPCRWRDDRAAVLAHEHDAVLALGRLEGRDRPGVPTLSPAAMSSVSGVKRLVLPSPNGSTTCEQLAATGVTVLGACLRNAGAVAAWLAPRLAAGARVALVPAGERWPDDTLRPAVEDLWGAGAVLAALPRDLDLSPEAEVALAAWSAVSGRLTISLAACASGRELVEAGFADDVGAASAHDVSAVVPVLGAGGFTDHVACG